MDGSLIAQADRKTKIFLIIVLIFELDAFASASGLGLFLIIEQLFKNKPILENVINLYSSGMLWIPLILLFLNGLFEGSGGYFNIEGVPGIRAVREKLYKK
jgi:hypothetical protein